MPPQKASFYVCLWGWGWNSGLPPGRASTLPAELLPQPSFLFEAASQVAQASLELLAKDGLEFPILLHLPSGCWG